MPSAYWPLRDLRLSTRDLELRPTCEADLETLADILPADLELDPSAQRFALGADPVVRGTVIHQAYWKAVGTWHPESWALPFTARLAGRIVGSQWLESTDFARLRTVDSASWLVADVRGRGLGRQLRLAVLGLAFGPLVAEQAITSAWHDNAGSLGVSRSLGYRPNGVSALWRAEHGAADELMHLRLDRPSWVVSARQRDVRITGVERCMPLFGLSPDGSPL